MSEENAERPALRLKTTELVVAALVFLFGAVVVLGSWRLGARWAADGPQPGYFPFYVGLIICVSSAVSFVLGLRIRGESNTSFVSVEALRKIASVLVPTVVFVALVGWLGIYVAGALFIGFFMRWLGRYAWWKVALIAVGTSVVFFLIFEIWFLVPLPKGPVEALLHLD